MPYYMQFSLVCLGATGNIISTDRVVQVLTVMLTGFAS